MNRPQNSIPIEDAKRWAKKWQRDNPSHCKAFLIPVVDLIQVLEIMGVLVPDGENGKYRLTNTENAYIRSYLSIDEQTQVGHGEKLLIVGTAEDSNGIYRDLVEGERPLGPPNDSIDERIATLQGSGVFDFTRPCPNDCDPNSPLYNP